MPALPHRDLAGRSGDRATDDENLTSHLQRCAAMNLWSTCGPPACALHGSRHGARGDLNNRLATRALPGRRNSCEELEERYGRISDWFTVFGELRKKMISNGLERPAIGRHWPDLSGGVMEG